MEITDLVRRGKSELYKTYINGEYVCLLEAEVIVKHKIKIGTILNEEQFALVREESEAITCKNEAINYVSKCLKTKKQVFDHLKQKGYLTSSINNAIELLLSYGYLNDKYYAESFIKTKESSKGILYLKNALKQKGVSNQIIDEVFADFEQDESVVLQVANKYLKNKTLDQKTKEKLYRHLLSKGFNFEQAQKAINIALKNLE